MGDTVLDRSLMVIWLSDIWKLCEEGFEGCGRFSRDWVKGIKCL